MSTANPVTTRARQILLTPEEFTTLVETQALTNIAYSGEDWRDLIEPGQWLNCISCEWQEFLEEITQTWKWYEKREPKYERQKALFELVDTAHFMAALLLHYTTPQGLAATYRRTLEGLQGRRLENFPRFLLGNYQDKHMVLDQTMCDFKRSVVQRNGEEAVRNFIKLVSSASLFMGYDAADFFKAYKLKNERNMGRVAKGVMNGVDVKSSESELVIQ